jgi:hypothetical protein
MTLTCEPTETASRANLAKPEMLHECVFALHGDKIAALACASFELCAQTARPRQQNRQEP